MDSSLSSSGQRSWELDAVVEGVISPDDPTLLFEDLEEIGHGATADISKALDKSNNQVVAIKKFKSACKQEDDWKEIMKEIKFLDSCKSEFILNYYGSYMSKHRVWIVLEYCLGSCSDVLELFAGPLAEDEIRAVSHSVLQGLSYLHGEKKLHRDLKSGNILVTDEAKVKLADFGASADLSLCDGKANTFIGSPYWMAPEVIMAMEDGTYSYPADVWSFGITMIELAETKPPLFQMQAMSALFHIPQRDPPQLSSSSWSKEFVSFLDCMLKKEPEDRMTCAQLLDHEFIKGHESTFQPTLNTMVQKCKSKVKGELDVSGLDPMVIVEENTNDEASQATSEPESSGGLQRKLSKYNTIRLPSSVLREKQSFVDGHLMDAQMKELRRRQRRHVDALKQLSKEHQQQIANLTRRLMEQVEDLKRRHDVAESVAVRDWRGEIEKLKKVQDLERKKQEEAFKKMIEKRKSDVKSQIKAQKKVIKQEEADKSARKEAETEIETSLMDKFKSEKQIYMTSCMEIVHAKQELVVERLKMEHVLQELQLKERHLNERATMAAEQKTGQIHELMRQHVEEKHKINMAQQEKRHKLERQQISVRHDKALQSVQRKHTTQAKKKSRALKHVSLKNEEVQAIYRRNTSGQFEKMMGTADKKLAKQLEKMEKEALHEAKSLHVREETVKLNKQQVEELERMKSQQEEEVKELDLFLAQRRKNLEQVHNSEVEALENKIATEKEAARKYKEMERKNFLQIKTRMLAERQNHLDEAEAEKKKAISHHFQHLKRLSEWTLPKAIEDILRTEATLNQSDNEDESSSINSSTVTN